MNHPRIVFWSVVVEVSVGAAALGIGWLFGVDPALSLRFEARDVVIGLGAVPPLGLLCLWTARSNWRPMRRTRRLVLPLIRATFQGCSTLDLLTVAITAGLGEELFFRGLVQAGIARASSPALGWITASMLFGLAHPLTKTYAVIVALMGLYLGGLWWWTGSLTVVIITHAAYDFAALIWLTRGGGSKASAS